MSSAAWLQVVALVVLVLAGTRLLGPYLARVYEDGAAPFAAGSAVSPAPAAASATDIATVRLDSFALDMT